VRRIHLRVSLVRCHSISWASPRCRERPSPVTTYALTSLPRRTTPRIEHPLYAVLLPLQNADSVLLYCYQRQGRHQMCIRSIEFQDIPAP